MVACAPEQHERRKSPRQTLVVKGMLFSSKADLPPQRVFIANISMLGVAMHVAQPVEPGTGYRMSVEAGPMTMRRSIRVVSCKRIQHEVYEIGAEFLTGDAHEPRRAVERVPRNPCRQLSPRI